MFSDVSAVVFICRILRHRNLDYSGVECQHWYLDRQHDAPVRGAKCYRSPKLTKSRNKWALWMGTLISVFLPSKIFYILKLWSLSTIAPPTLPLSPQWRSSWTKNILFRGKQHWLWAVWCWLYWCKQTILKAMKGVNITFAIFWGMLCPNINQASPMGER